MAGPIKIAILADSASATRTMREVGAEAERMGSTVEASGRTTSSGFERAGQAAVGMNAAVETATSALAGLDAIQNGAANEARRLARAQAAVEQASIDGEQATIDLRQATEDLKQSQIDGSQAAVDIEQARIDQKQADLDAAVALKEYNAAVRESGAGSAEARQAEIDLAQAKADAKQASIDLTQAAADERQATIDASQAKVDGAQASRDAKDAQLDLNDAQREADPTPIQQAMNAAAMYAPVIGAAAVVTQAFAGTAIAARVATLAGAAATGVATAAQWALNVALTANPIGIVIALIAALVVSLVVAYRRSETFRRIVDGALRAVGAGFAWVWNKGREFLGWLTRMPAAIKAAFNGANTWLADAGRRIIDGLIGSVQRGFDRVRRKFQELTNLIPDWKGPAARDRDLLRKPADLIMDGFAERLDARFGGVRSMLSTATNSLAPAVARGAAAGGGPTQGGTGGTVRLVADGGTGDVGRLLVALLAETTRKGGGLRAMGVVA